MRADNWPGLVSISERADGLDCAKKKNGVLTYITEHANIYELECMKVMFFIKKKTQFRLRELNETR